MNNQCNTCGGYHDIKTCQHCQAPLCPHCKLWHEPSCEEIQKAKRRGEGATVANAGMPAHRAGHETPETTPPDKRMTEDERQAAIDAILDKPMHHPDNAPFASTIDPTGFAAHLASLTGQSDATIFRAAEPSSSSRWQPVDPVAAPLLERLPTHTILVPIEQTEIDQAVAAPLSGILDPLGLMEGMTIGVPYKVALAAAEQIDIDTALAGIADLIAEQDLTDNK